MSKGLAVILSGPSGAGKSTIIQRLRQFLPGLEFSISCTTRPPRPGEQDGVHYYFCTEADFEAKRDAGELLESAHVHTASYGTPKTPVADAIQRGAVILLDIDVQGARQIRAAIAGTDLEPSFLSIFIAPPSLEVLEQRLRGRGTETEAAIQTRLANARRELDAAPEYQHTVVNDTVDRAAAELRDLIEAARQ
jgi:guanylate kinase